MYSLKSSTFFSGGEALLKYWSWKNVQSYLFYSFLILSKSKIFRSANQCLEKFLKKTLH